MAVAVLSLQLFRFGGNKPENSGCGDSVLLSAASPRVEGKESGFENLGMQSKISFKIGSPKIIFYDSKIYCMKRRYGVGSFQKDSEPFCSLQNKQILQLPSNYTVKNQS